jgi:hypothetical protein
MTRSALLALVAAVATGLLALPAEAQWKWKDKSGRVQYSDLPPPPGTPDADILGRPGAGARRPVPASPAALEAAGLAASGAVAASAPALQPRTADPELEAKRKIAEQEQQKKVKELEAKLASAKADNCARAKGSLQTIDSGIRLARTNEKGEREFLDDAQRGAERKRAQDAIASDCR